MATIKCPNCGVYNKDKDYCEECQTVLSYKIRRDLALKKENEERLKREASKEKEPAFFEKYSNHRYFLVRIVSKFFHSIWLVFMAIGMFIAWLISFLAA